MYNKLRDKAIKSLMDLREFKQFDPEDIMIRIRELGGDDFMRDMLHAYLSTLRRY